MKKNGKPTVHFVDFIGKGIKVRIFIFSRFRD